MSRDARLFLDDIAASCQKILRYTEGLSFQDFRADDKTFDAASRNLEIIGEAVPSRGLEAAGGERYGKETFHPYKRTPAMLAKLTSKNQLTLPKKITNEIGPAEYFDIEVRKGQIVLTPVRIQRADALRAKLAELDLGEQDIADAVAWARNSENGAR